MFPVPLVVMKDNQNHAPLTASSTRHLHSSVLTFKVRVNTKPTFHLVVLLSIATWDRCSPSSAANYGRSTCRCEHAGRMLLLQKSTPSPTHSTRLFAVACPINKLLAKFSV